MKVTNKNDSNDKNIDIINKKKIEENDFKENIMFSQIFSSLGFIKNSSFKWLFLANEIFNEEIKKVNKMKNTSKNKNTMTKWGISPKIFLILLPFIIFFSLLHFIYYPRFILPIPQIFMIFIGIFLITIGLIIYFKAIKIINKAFKNEELLTSGIYGHMRHPLYSAIILFITPGIVLLFNSWILFFIPIIYYIIFRFLIKREEKYCLDKFGEKYIQYKRKVYAVFPKIKEYKSNIASGGKKK